MSDDARTDDMPTLCWWSPTLGFLVPDPLSDDGGAIRVANRYVVDMPDDAIELAPVDRLRARVAELEKQVVVEVDRTNQNSAALQRAYDRVVELETAGDNLADEVETRDTEYGPLARDVQAWRSVRGER